MINQLTNSPNSSVFAPLQSNGAPYAITKPLTTTQKQEQEKAKDKKSSKLGTKIAIAAAGIGFGALILTQLLSKKSFGTILKTLEAKASKIGENKQLNQVQNLYYSGVQKAKLILQNSQGIFTFANLKDIWFWKALTKFSPTKKFFDFTTKIFEDVAKQTSKSSYKKTSSLFTKMEEEFGNINEKIDFKKTEKIEKLIDEIKTLYNKGFGIRTINKRYSKRIEEPMKNLAEKFWKETYGKPKEFFTNKDSYTKFFTEDLVSAPKQELIDEVKEAKRILTLGKNDNYSSLKEMMGDIDPKLDPTNKTLRTLISDINKNLEKYKTTGNEDAKNIIIEKLNSLNSLVEDAGLKTKFQNGINVLSDTNAGKIEEIMKHYKELLPEEDYIKLEKTVNKALKSLDTSIDLESNQLFDKIRDLRLGSAPHDVLALVSSLALVGWGLTKAENKDERISVALKGGIPAIGAVATSLYCTMGLVSGGKSLLFGILSGLIINRIGETIDYIRKKKKEDPVEQANPAKILTDLKENLS